MPLAIDIITYIGVPLAVIGVLPIIWTTFTSIVTYRRIHDALRHNNVSPRTRGSLMSRVMELDFDRYALAPLSRADPQYWTATSHPSSLKGGSWTLFHWNVLPTGRIMYRVMYEDEIRQPQAEVEFEALVAFLLDRGAVPVPEGWEKLRVSGLWTPPGTKLLMAPDGIGTVLAVTNIDESDGHLSLRCWWEERWGGRGVGDLPPYWMSVKRQASFGAKRAGEEDKALDSDQKKEETDNLLGEKLDEPRTLTEEIDDILCFRLSSSGIAESYTTTISNPTNAHTLHTPHLLMYNDNHSPAGLWFACIATALSQQRTTPPSTPSSPSKSAAVANRTSNTALWSYTISSSSISFTSRSCIPSGVLVLLGMCPPDKAPAFHTIVAASNQAIHHERHLAFTRRISAQAAEARMAPAQRDAARIAREATERQQVFEDMARERQRRQERVEQEAKDALGSIRWPARKVVEACCEGQEKITMDGVLWRMAVEEEFAKRLADMLDRWKSWTEGPGVSRREVDEFSGDIGLREMLLIAARVVVCLAGAFEESSLGTPRDMKESMRSWGRVRLG